MLIQKDILSQIRGFGLNSYESRLWAALLAKGTATAGELSDIANVPRSRTYDVLESLERKGFIILRLGKPIKYFALSPESVLETVKKKIGEDAAEKTRVLNKLKETDLITQLNVLHKSGMNLVEPFELSGSLRGRKNIYNHIETLMKSAKASITISTSEDGILRKKDAFFKTLKKARDRGVKIRIAAPFNNLSPEGKKEIAELKGIAEVRHTSANARFCVIDSSHLIFMVLDDKQTNQAFDTGIWVTTPFFSSAFERMFDASLELNHSDKVRF